MDDKLDLEFILGALASKDDSNVVLILNLLSVQNLHEYFNTDQVNRLVTALLKVSSEYKEPVTEEIIWYGQPKKVVNMRHIFTHVVGVDRGYGDRIKKDKKFQKMTPYKQADFLIRKMLYLWKDKNGIKNE